MIPMKKSLLALSMTFIISLTGCVQSDEVKEVRIEKKEAIKQEMNKAGGKPLRIAIGAMITPKEGFAYYRYLLDYIGEKLGRTVEFINKKRYAETNELLKSGLLDAAFVCGRPYVDGHDEFGLRLLVAPQAHGETVYYSYFIVNKDSPVEELSDLRGKSFVFVDPESNTGKW